MLTTLPPESQKCLEAQTISTLPKDPFRDGRDGGTPPG